MDQSRRGGIPIKKVSFIALLVGFLLNVFAFSEAFSTGTFTTFGPKDYTRNTGKPKTVTEHFSVLNPKTSYMLHVYNGGNNKQFKEKVSSAVISLNGVEVVKPHEFRRHVSHIKKPITLSKANKLAVKLQGKPDSGLTIEIIGVDRRTPAIVATVTPSPNDAGWNNTNVTVTFTCSDTTSGIASCPGDVLLPQDGANQVITGTATDIAGNTASASVTVNLDKTPPVVTMVSPLPGATIEDPSVIVQGTINETLSGVASITCNGTPTTLSGFSFTCNIALVTGQNTIQTAATDLAGNTGYASITVSYLGPKYLGIVDVMVTDSENFSNVPSDYTGLAWGGTPTNPYIPGVIGTRVISNDVNLGLGTHTTIWVKYDFVPVGSDQPVLVDYGSFQWPNWSSWCPLGWQPANGTSSGIQGALTTGMYDCKTNGLCVRYEPMNQTENFITNVYLSYTSGSEAACPALGEANLGYWPMQPDNFDIDTWTDLCAHGKAGYLYLCYGRGKAWPPAPTSIEATDTEKLDLLQTYAPRVWLAENESYWPSSVDWAFPYLVRTYCIDLGYVKACGGSPRYCIDCGFATICGPNRCVNCGGGRTVCGNPEPGSQYWLFTREGLDNASDVLDFFHGCNGSLSSNCTISDVPVYAYWVKKQIQVGEELVDIVDLVYFFYYPYNRGKNVLGWIWGNHVGDWEHVTVRLMWGYDDQTGWSLQPVQMYLSAHDFGGIYGWDEIPKINDTHPVVYSAWGSHGVWKTAGAHVYGSAMGTDLVDECSEGTAWDTWNYLEAFDYNANQGLDGNTWPVWMSDDFADPGIFCEFSNPACGPIYRWGNMEDECLPPPIGYCILENGPTGPVSKGVWSPGILK